MSDIDFGESGHDWAVNVSFADFNHDGHPEVYVRNKIYNAETGTLLVTANTTTHYGASYAHWTNTGAHPYKLSSPIAADVCGDVKLDLILGNEVYDVNINNLAGTLGNSITLAQRVTPPGDAPEDGHPQVADFNHDGYLDVFVSVRNTYESVGYVYGYVWDIHNQTVSAPFVIRTGWSGKSIPLIADIDNNNLMEVLIQSEVSWDPNKFQAYKYHPDTRTFTLEWGFPTDENSYSNSITAFDFNQDGLLELMISDQNTMRIVNGSGISHITHADTIPMYVLNSFPFSQNTIMQYPVIADVDADGSAEIVSVGSDRLNILKSSTSVPWAPARKVWNQYMYNVTNVNEDLTIPQYLFNNATVFTDPEGIVRRPFNNFLQQATTIDRYGRPFYAVPDVAVEPSASSQMIGDSLVLTISYCNLGDNTLNAPYPVTLFANTYGGDTVCTVTIGEGLPVDSCTRLDIHLPITSLCVFPNLDSLVIAVNGNIGGIAQNGGLQSECDTTNNAVTVTITMHSDTTRLTATACDSYLWYSDTLTQSGEYVRVLANATGCDSVEVLQLTIISVPALSHTLDTVIIAGTSASLWAAGADVLAWTDSSGNILASGSSLTVSPNTSTMYYLTGQNYSAAAGNNLVVNGDFEQGNVGFTSAYTHVYTCSVLNEGYYTVGVNAHDYHPGFYNGPDQTTGTGNYMIINGAMTSNTNVWTQTVTVAPNTDYAFSTWVCSVGGSSQYPTNLAQLQFSVNGNQLGNIFTAPNAYGVWSRYYEVWNSGNNTSAVITILNQNTAAGGNDFGLDDIVFAPLTNCSVTDSIQVVVSGYPDNVDSADCTFLPEGTEFGIAPPIISNVGNANIASIPMVGDIDEDGRQEIVIPAATNYISSKIHIYNSDGTLKTQFNIIQTYIWNSVGIAKVRWDNNSSKTIIVVFGTNKYLYAYDATGTQLWQSNQPFSSHNGEPYMIPAISFADFNHDGWTEIYLGSEIFDAATGILLCKTNDNKGCADRTWSWYNTPYQTMAANLCGDSRLELAIGNTIYDVDIQSRTDFSANQITVARQLPSSAMTMEDNSPIPFTDGNTFLADINLDGSLDVIVMNVDGNNRILYLYVWDVITNDIICTKKITNARKFGTPQTGDLDNDGYPEICFITGTYSDHGTGNNDKIHALKYNPSNSNGAMDVFWSIPHEDNSGSTGLTMFDFNQDGYVELVYRDVYNLRIINGSLYDHQTGLPVAQPYNLASFPCQSSTGVEYPVIADVDLDGEVEIIVGGATSNTAYGNIYIFKSAGVPWAPARKVWNQYMYNVTNVNEDLTIPQYLFNNATAFTDPQGVVRRPFNNFLQQATTIDQYGRPFYAVPDVAVNQASIQTAGDSVSVTVSYCNLGDNTLNAPYPVTIFANAYGGDTVCTVMMSENLPVDSCTQGVIQLPVNALCGFHGLDSLVVAVNGNNVGIAQNGSLQPECDTTNNMAAVPITMHIDTTHLTASACDSYLWYGDTLTQSGEYAHTLTNAAGCDSVVTLHLTIIPVPALSHTLDTVIIAGTSANLWAAGADVLAWTDSSGNILASGPSLTVSPQTSTLYYLTGQNYSAAAGNNLVVNGDFEQGNVGFGTDYQYVTGYNNMYYGRYSITEDGILIWGNDHLYGYGGTGQFMVVDGATSPNSVIWQQTVQVAPNTYYAFSAQVASTLASNTSNSYALLQFSVNDIQLGDIFHSPNVLNVWQPYYEVWYSGNNTTATLKILNQNNNGGGNDFGLDDIVFAPLTNCSVTDSIYVVVSGYPDNVDSADCTVFSIGHDWGIDLDWSSAEMVSPLVIPLVGDIDGDEVPEIICFAPNDFYTYYGSDRILIFNTLSHQIVHTINLPNKISTVDAAPYGIVRLPNGHAIVVVALQNYTMYAYDLTAMGTAPLWSVTTNYYAPNVSFADFNGDTYPEICVGNKIYDAETGTLLISDPSITNTASSWAHNGDTPLPSPCVANVVGDSKPDLILGNEIYEVLITNRNGTAGNSITLAKSIVPPAGVSVDGHPQVADFNLDGHLDVFVSKKDSKYAPVGCYVWDVYNNTVSNALVIPTTENGKSIPLIADVDNDDTLEIVIQCRASSGNKVKCYKYNAATAGFDFMWDIYVDEDSYSNSMSVFDFNNDGENDLLISDQTTVRIVNGSGHSHLTGNDTIPVYVLTSLSFGECTVMQYPIVADVDADGSAELVVLGRFGSGHTYKAYLNIFKSAGIPWAPARKVWNQYMYNVTNVNEDLTIPQYLFNNATAFTDPQGVVRRPFNNFLQQATTIDRYGRPFYAVPDVAVGPSASSQMIGDSLVLTFSYCNNGDNTLNAPYPVTVFANAYGGDTVCTVTVGENLPVDSCAQGEIRLPISAVCGFANLDSLVIAVNGNSGGIAQNGGLQPECDTTNNTAAVAFSLQHDTTRFAMTACDHYLWYGDTLTQSGEYAHTLTSVAGCDSVEVLQLTIISVPALSHTLDTVIIAGTSADLWASGADVLAWTDSSGNILASGPSLTVSPTTPTMYYLTGQSSGCSTTDSVRVHVMGYPDNVFDVDCVFPPDSNAFEMVELFKCQNVNSMSTPMVADMDGDGLPEIIACCYTYSAPWYSAGFHVVNGQTGELKYDISTVQYRNAGQMMTIADVDYDGKSELFLMGRDRKIYCYNYNGGIRWTSTNTVDNNYLLSAADVNNDGEAEIVCGKYIYNAQTGALLLEGTMVETGMGFGAPHSVDSYHPAYYMYALGDVDGDGTPELCAGNTVYKMHIVNTSGTIGNNWSILRQASLPDSIVNKDGQTFIVDFDNDGDFDICVIGVTHSLNNYTHSHTLDVYVWDGQTSQLIAHSPLVVNSEWGASIPYSGDLNGDGFPEIIFAVTNVGMLAYTYDTITSTMRMVHNHAPFGETSGFTVFDFNQDGRNEIVYRGTQQLFIVDGITLDNLNAPVTAYSGTVTEYPVVADVNADGHAEIIVTRAYYDWSTGNANGWVAVYGSQVPGAWSSARKVWNQWAYSSVNINEDMTVPQYRFDVSTTFPNGKKPFNSFLRQMPYIDSQGDLFNAAADVAVAGANAVLQGDTVILSLNYCNTGDNILFAPYPVTIFANAYVGDTVCTVTVGENLPVDSCTQGEIRLPISAVCGFANLDSLVVAVNGNSGGIAQNGGLQPECDTTNNTAAVAFSLQHDTTRFAMTACDHYLWYDDTLTQSGEYTQVLANAVGCDSVVVMTLQVNPLPIAAISGRTVLCDDSAVTLAADNAASYLWSTGETTRLINVAEEGMYSLTVTNQYGCEAVATHYLMALDNPFLSVTLPNMCAGGSYMVSVGSQQGSNILLGQGETTLSVTDTVFLPDGVYCEPYGCSYRSPLTFTAYAPGDTIQSPDDIYYVRLNMEHSWIGDLYINITCPNGQKADLMKYGGSGSSECSSYIQSGSRGWQSGLNAYTSTDFGQAVSGYSSSCYYPSTRGIGWNYCWSENTTQGYAYAPGAGSLIYRSDHAHNSRVDSSNVAAGTNFYHPDDPFANLIGCPLNGQWYIEVQDGWSGDDGYLFEWELSLSSRTLSQATFEFSYANVDGPWLSVVNDSLFILNPPADLAHDTVVAYTFYVSDSTGCTFDTTVNVTFYATRHVEMDTAVCESFTWNDSIYTVNGQYVQTFTSAVGCDSVVTMNMTVRYGTHNVVTETACENFVWHGTTYTTSGVYTYSYTNANGCTSVDTLHLTVHHGTHNVATETACESFVWHGTTYAASGTYTYAYTNANGCPSVDTLHLTVHYGTHNVEMETVCESFVWHGTTYTASGTYTYAYTNANGCSSVDTLHLTVHYGTHNVEMETACENFVWHGTTYTTSGIYTYSYTNANGCTSVDTLHLTVHHGTHNVATETACESFVWHGTTYTTSGTYTYAYTNASGCPSVDTLHLTVHYGTHNAETETVCESFVWHGTTYTTSGTYTYAYTNANGCSSVDTLHLTIHYGTHNVTDTSVCESYEWHGETYTASGTYTYAYINADDCPSADTLHLTVLPVYEFNFEDVICEGQTYTGHGFVVQSDQTIGVSDISLTHNLQSQGGCDSVLNLSLTIVDTAVHIIPLTEDFCDNMMMELSVVTSMTDYVWSTGEAAPTITVTSPGVYSVTTYQQGCEVTASYDVPLCEWELYLPNAITPYNPDGLNDYFCLLDAQKRWIYDFEIYIYDRWGELVYFSRDKDFRWDGSVNGQLYTNVVYNYTICFKDKYGERFMRKGMIVVIG